MFICWCAECGRENAFDVPVEFSETHNKISGRLWCQYCGESWLWVDISGVVCTRK